MPFRWDESPRSARNINAVALLKPGATIEQARAELTRIAAAARRDVSRHESRVRRAGRCRSATATSAPAIDRIGVILMTAVGFVLLIMCANLANLMLVRGASRQRELAVRSAMGAGRGRLLWATLSESVLLAVPGAALGLLLSQWAVDWMIGAFPERRCRTGSTSASTARVVAVRDRRRGLHHPRRRACCRRFARSEAGSRQRPEGRRAAALSLGRGGQRLQAGAGDLAGGAVLRLAGWRQPDGAAAFWRCSAPISVSITGPILTARGYLAGDAYNDIAARAAFYQQRRRHASPHCRASPRPR